MKDIILIAEDDPQFSSLLRNVFEQHSSKLTVVCASDGEEAIAALKQMTISILVTDLQMPNVDGLGLLAYVNENHPDLPCIVMTSFMQDHKTFKGFVRALQPDINDLITTDTFHFFNKPFKIDTLVNTVFQILEYKTLGGSIHGISIASFIQMIEMDQKTCQVEVHASPKSKSGSQRGILFFENGILYDAEYGSLKGEEAAIKIIATDNLNINIQKNRDDKVIRKIKTESIGLIMEAMRRKDESED
jgi:CheY-like chemotaxis protein